MVADRIVPSAGTMPCLDSSHRSILFRMVLQEMEKVQVCFLLVSTVVSSGSTGTGFPSGTGSVRYLSLPVEGSIICLCSSFLGSSCLGSSCFGSSCLGSSCSGVSCLGGSCFTFSCFVLSFLASSALDASFWGVSFFAESAFFVSGFAVSVFFCSAVCYTAASPVSSSAAVVLPPQAASDSSVSAASSAANIRSTRFLFIRCFLHI